jgi:hypothetical protein
MRSGPAAGWQATGRTALGCGLLAWLAAASLPAQAQGSWIWLDAQGRKVFSDVPPPASVPEQRIQQRPAGKLLPATSPPPSTPETAGMAVSAAPRQNPAPKSSPESGVPLYQRNEQALRDNCRRARSALQTLNSGLRLMRLNEQGEQVELDATSRAQEIERMQQAERDHCVPARNKGKPQ